MFFVADTPLRLLTTFDFVMRDKSDLGRVHWNFLIIDEGHRIKNSQSKLALTLGKSYHPKARRNKHTL